MTEVITERRVWNNADGKETGYTVNFRGGCDMVMGFEYVCLTCAEHAVIQHKRSDPMKGRSCTKCAGVLSRYHDVAPMMDADYHDSCRSYNIGWDEENGID